MFSLAIHGGAGVITRQHMSEEQQQEYQAALRMSLEAGYEILKDGGSALDACESAVKVMEDCPLFNAGKGAVFTHNGYVEMDASVMDGSTGQAGAVAGVHKLRNPIVAARMVMEKSPHVLLCGDGAEAFAVSYGARVEEPSYFYTERRWKQLQALLAEEAEEETAAIAAGGSGSNAPIARVALDHSVQVKEEPLSTSLQPSQLETAVPHDATSPSTVGGRHASSFSTSGSSGQSGGEFPVDGKSRFGTVGAVARDIHGNLAAATSTGGMSNKRWGRVGDSPIIGAGTYANNATCAVSGTGHGEYFIRLVVAYRVAALMEYGGLNLEEATRKVVHQVMVDAGGEGGLIAVDAHGNVSLPFNSEGMYRGFVKQDGAFHVSIFGDDE